MSGTEAEFPFLFLNHFNEYLEQTKELTGILQSRINILIKHYTIPFCFVRCFTFMSPFPQMLHTHDDPYSTLHCETG